MLDKQFKIRPWISRVHCPDGALQGIRDEGASIGIDDYVVEVMPTGSISTYLIAPDSPPNAWLQNTRRTHHRRRRRRLPDVVGGE
jgi:hypothetical protein